MLLIEFFSVETGFVLPWIVLLQFFAKFFLLPLVLLNAAHFKKNGHLANGIRLSFFQNGATFVGHLLLPEEKGEENEKSIFENYLELLNKNKISDFNKEQSDETDSESHNAT